MSIRPYLAALALFALPAPPALAQGLPDDAGTAQAQGPEAGPGQGTRQGRRPRSEPGTSPRTVTLDFDSGIKTTLMADGSVLEEGFDPRAMRRIASRKDGKGVTGSASGTP